MSTLREISAALRQKPVILGTLLVLVSITLYAPTAHHEFLMVDDSAYITENTHVTTGITVSNVVWAFTDFSTFYWHPVTWISHMTDCQVFGLNAGPHHLVNAVLHAINVFLLFFLLQRATGAVWRSFFVAALFAIHPMNVETVAWVAERKSLLSALFSLLTIAAYGWYVRSPGWQRYLLVMLMFALALMSKSMAVTLPIVLLLIDYWPLCRDEDLASVQRWKNLFLGKIPLLFLSVLSSVVTVVGQRAAGAVVAVSDLPLHMRVENALTSYVSYIGKLVWPGSLAIFYPHPASKLPQGGHLPPGEIVASLGILLGITAIVLHFRQARFLIVGWFAFLITLFPVSGVMQAGLQGMADRFAYVPYIGLFVILVWSVADLVQSQSRPSLAPVLVAVGSCIVVAYALSASRYLAYWQNGATLMEHARTVAGAPDAMIESLLADAYYSSGQPLKALPHYRTWCQLVPKHDLCHYNLAQVLFQQGELREALREYQIAASLTHDQGIALACANKSRQALSMIRENR